MGELDVEKARVESLRKRLQESSQVREEAVSLAEWNRKMMEEEIRSKEATEAVLTTMSKEVSGLRKALAAAYGRNEELTQMTEAVKKYLEEARGHLDEEIASQEKIRLALGSVRGQLGMGPSSGDPLDLQVLEVGDRAKVRSSENHYSGCRSSPAVVLSHYVNVNLEALSQGFVEGSTAERLMELEGLVEPYVAVLAPLLESMNDPVPENEGTPGDAEEEEAGRDDE
ncbi:unnamed protein product [Urochloa humidicola]